MTDSRTQQRERWPGEAADQQEQDKRTTWGVRGIVVDTAPDEPIMLVTPQDDYRRYLTAEEARELGSYLIAASLISLGYDKETAQ